MARETGVAVGRAGERLALERRADLKALADRLAAEEANLGLAHREYGPDFDVSLALLLGPLIYWHVFLRRTSRNPRSLAQGVVDAFWRAFGATGPVEQSVSTG